MGISFETLGASKAYTEETVAGAGAIKGAPCQIQSITEITGGHRVTFLWVDNEGTSHTSTMDVMDGAQGETGATGKGIKNSYVDEELHFIIVYDDDTEKDCGEITVIQRDQNEGYIPVGTVMGVFSETAPRFYLKCDGTAYNKADYPELSALLLGLTTHSQYEVDGDETKFKVPDLRGEFLRGTGANSHAVIQDSLSGADVGVHQDPTGVLGYNFDDRYNEHKIDILRTQKGENSSIINSDGYVGPTTAKDNIYRGQIAVTNYAQMTYETALPTKIATRPTNTSVLYCIAYKDIFLTPSIDYSADEKLIGTWITGANLYQKTVPTGGSVPAGATLIEKITQTGYDTLRYTKA